ncbi:MAG: phospholipid carrier-dependent glycosyltransferase [Isosphaeraceae bacterium]|nr:phospholipid carrier-dependent glycosyltransferase [Isosphaeraceae bacterium]
MTAPAYATPPHGPTRRVWAWAAVVAVVSAAWFGSDLAGERHFVDESAFIAQAYFADLFARGRTDDRAWLEYPAFDLPPLPKYLIGGALTVAGYPLPGQADAWQWYGNTSYRAESPAMLVVARWPSVLSGALGCVAIFALGTLAFDLRAGLLAALFLMLNPLYRLLARRAMADAPAEALILVTAAVALWAWRGTLSGRWPIPARLAIGPVLGVLGGLAILTKLNGALGLMIVASWAVLALVLPGFPIEKKGWVLVEAAIAAPVAFATFVALNPFMTAPAKGLPPELAQHVGTGLERRTEVVLSHRAQVSREAQKLFPSYALTTPIEKLKVVAVQGFGRFGLFGPRDHDSTKPYPRFDAHRDRGAWLWLPWVLAGAAWAVVRGGRQARAGQPPTAWAALLQAAVAFGTITAFIPLAWDRYVLSIQPGAALLAAGVASAAWAGAKPLWNGRTRPATDPHES